ncbi:major tail sheath protein [Paenibacillus phage phiERICV]|uniref:Major tail sheath protein n=1 Tax=Paenibacillus larvae subsp. larvae TaxID=147375 RepID=A0A6C0QN94_9BACL|nr:phage tail sheath family protein [Paenibacillus larvae]QHZ50030.1 major tail sheath protein [Paenibacillus larvae subsp. larvae]QHZ54115.1 major tail sheath protein [Paenibacillus phage phiERICV]
MAERHGIYTTEAPFSVPTPVSPMATLPVVFGTAPVNLTALEKPPVNLPVLCKSWTEAVEAFGYSDDWESFTLCEMMYSHFQLYKQSPVVFVNVLDPAKHKTTVAPKEVAVVAGMATIQVEGIIKDSVVVKSTDGATTYQKDKDYTLAFNKSGFLVVSIKPGGAIESATQLNVGYDKLDRTTVTSADIIGGTDPKTGTVTGLELIKQIFPRFQMVPGLLLAPGFSHDPEVAAVMKVKGENLNGHFKSTALVDLPADRPYPDLAAWKKENKYDSHRQIVGYPKLIKSGKVYHFSTQLAGVICQTDKENNGVPYRSPSNKPLQVDGAVLDDGTEVALGPDEAEYLNGQGIVAALNFIGGWRTFGNRTAAFPEVVDSQNAFIPIRRMMDWIQNYVTLTYWQHLDDPSDKRLIETVTDSLNIWFNGLQASGFILGGRVEFHKEDNPDYNLVDGKLKFRIYFAAPSPAQDIEFVVEYDAQYLAAIG